MRCLVKLPDNFKVKEMEQEGRERDLEKIDKLLNWCFEKAFRTYLIYFCMC